MQAKFFQALVIPLYKELAKTYPKCRQLLDNAEANMTEWEKCNGVIPQIASTTPKIGSPIRRSLLSPMPSVDEGSAVQ